MGQNEECLILETIFFASHFDQEQPEAFQLQTRLGVEGVA